MQHLAWHPTRRPFTPLAVPLMGAAGTDPKETNINMAAAEELPEPAIPDAVLPTTPGPAPMPLQWPVDVRSALLVKRSWTIAA